MARSQHRRGRYSDGPQLPGAQGVGNPVQSTLPLIEAALNKCVDLFEAAMPQQPFVKVIQLKNDGG